MMCHRKSAQIEYEPEIETARGTYKPTCIRNRELGRQLPEFRQKAIVALPSNLRHGRLSARCLTHPVSWRKRLSTNSRIWETERTNSSQELERYAKSVACAVETARMRISTGRFARSLLYLPAFKRLLDLDASEFLLPSGISALMNVYQAPQERLMSRMTARESVRMVNLVLQRLAARNAQVLQEIMMFALEKISRLNIVPSIPRSPLRPDPSLFHGGSS
jgi:hypothetical protein